MPPEKAENYIPVVKDLQDQFELKVIKNKL